MENGNITNDLQSNVPYNNGTLVNKVPVLYKLPTYSHPSKRPIQSVGDVSSQNTVTVSLVNEREHQMPGQAVMQTSTILPSAAISSVNVQNGAFMNEGQKSGGMLMMSNSAPRTQSVIDNQRAHPGNIVNQLSGNIGNHGYHPGRHLHHQMQLKHLPQSSPGQLSHHQYQQSLEHVHQQQSLRPMEMQAPQLPPVIRQSIQQSQTLQQTHNFQQSIHETQPMSQQQQLHQSQVQSLQQPSLYQQQPQSLPQQDHPQQQVLQIGQNNSYQMAVVSRPYENMTYTRTYPQVNQQTCQYNSFPNGNSPNRARFLSTQSQNYPQYMMIRPQQPPNSQTPHLPSSHAVMTSQAMPLSAGSTQLGHPGFQNRTSTEQRLSHFDYGEHDDPVPSHSRSTPTKHPTGIDKQEKSPGVPTYMPGFVAQGAANGNVLNQVRPQPPVSESPPAGLKLRGQDLMVRAGMQPPPVGPLSRPPNVVASPATPPPLRPVILTAQQAGQAGQPLQSTPVLVHINGGKSIRGSIVSVSPQQMLRPPQSNPTHVYFTIPQASSAAKFVRTQNGHLRPVNGVAVQNSLSQSKMYTVRYVTPKPEDGKANTNTNNTNNNNSSSNNNDTNSNNNKAQLYPASSRPNNSPGARFASPKLEKLLIPRMVLSSPDAARKRRLTPTKSQPPSKLTKIDGKPGMSPQHNELLLRVNKSLDGDREAVLRPDCNTPFESFPDAFRKLMKYHIFYEPDTKESVIRRADKIHGEISEKLIHRKENMFNKYYQRFLNDSARTLPRFTEQSDVVTMLQQQVLEEKEKLEEARTELEEAREKKKMEDSFRASDNPSPNPEGPID